MSCEPTTIRTTDIQAIRIRPLKGRFAEVEIEGKDGRKEWFYVHKCMLWYHGISPKQRNRIDPRGTSGESVVEATREFMARQIEWVEDLIDDIEYKIKQVKDKEIRKQYERVMDDLCAIINYDKFTRVAKLEGRVVHSSVDSSIVKLVWIKLNVLDVDLPGSLYVKYSGKLEPKAPINVGYSIEFDEWFQRARSWLLATGIQELEETVNIYIAVELEQYK